MSTVPSLVAVGRESEGRNDDSPVDLFRRLEQLNEIGAALSLEKNLNALLEKILLAVKAITRADGGTLYLVEGESAEQVLRFEIVRTASLDIAMGGTTGNPIPFYPIHLFKNGDPNTSMVAAFAALTGQTVNIADAYTEEGFDFSGTRAFDAKTGYRSQSFLTVPMKNHEAEIIGVLQLINCQDPDTGEIVPFSPADQRLAESLASQAAIALTNRALINQLEHLFESFINMINEAIDEKSPYTGGHCQRVPTLTMMLAEAVNDTLDGPLAEFTDGREGPLRAADRGPPARLRQDHHAGPRRGQGDQARDDLRPHQPGRHAIRGPQARRRDRRAQQEARARAPGRTRRDHPSRPHLRDRRGPARHVRQIEEDRKFLRRCNIGAESMSKEEQDRVHQIGLGYKWRDSSGNTADFLTEDELKNLVISRGTLTQEEREIINHHIVSTIKMLEALPWPKHLRNVPEYAGGHHERMDGKGYPRGLTRDQMSVQARVMGIADIFEALTAKDRPYKKGKTLSESLHILGRFRLNGHIDPDLFDIFIRRRVYTKYAEQFLDAEQIDHVDEAKIPGYVP